MKWKHDDLLDDLIGHLAKPERMLWRDLQLGAAGSPRPDAYSIRKSFADPRPLAYEVKVSVADYRSDITSGKWQSYLQFACAVVFCVPAGLITKDDLPHGCGLMVRGPDGWRTVKGPTLHPITIPERALLKLLIEAHEAQQRRHRDAYAEKYWMVQRLREHLGEDVHRVLSDLDRARSDVERLRSEREAAMAAARAQADAIKATAKAAAEADHAKLKNLRDELIGVLGLEADASTWLIERALRRLQRNLDSDATLLKCRGAVTAMKRALADVEDRLSLAPEVRS